MFAPGPHLTKLGSAIVPWFLNWERKGLQGGREYDSDLLIKSIKCIR